MKRFVSITAAAFLAALRLTAGEAPIKIEPNEKPPFLFLYRSSDGIVAVATKVTIEDDGAWEAARYDDGGGPRRGRMTPENWKAFRKFF